MSNTEHEQRTLTYGREIFARARRSGPTAFTPAWVDDLLMNWTMGDPALKVQLFRFVEALPRLHDPAAIAGHLQEYLGGDDSALPPFLKWGLRFLPAGGLGGRLLAKAARFNAEHLARRFIAGSTVQEAIQAVARLRKQKLAFTVDLLGEATITEAEADAVRDQYLELISGLTQEVNHWPEIPLIDRDIHGPMPRVNVSVKLSALFSQFDPIDPEGTTRVVLSRLRPILRAAKANSAFVNFDMEQYSFKDTTLHIFRTVLEEPEFRDWPHVGIAIQAYLKDTEQDLEKLLVWARDQRQCPVWIRLVKGAYWDYETVIAAQNDWPVPVWQNKWQSDACFERCSWFLMRNYQWLRPAFGSHNVRSVSNVLAIADSLKIPPSAYEFQMLYGMGDEFKDVMISLDRRVRIYTPYGQLLPGMAYLVRRLLENTSNESFLRAGFRDNLPEDRLLMAPESRAAVLSNGHHPVVEKPTGFRNEPLSDFSKEENRQALSSALEQVQNQLGRSYPLIINHKKIETVQWIESRCPSHSQKVVGRVACATAVQAEQAIQAAKEAFPKWRDTPVKERAEVLRRAAQIMRERRFELSAWIIHESAKPWREADADVAESIDFCEFYAQEMLRLDQPRRRDVPGEENYMFYEPRGVAVVISPWNFPMAILCGMSVAALVAGNTVIMKPAEQSPVVASKLMDILMEAGAPAGAIAYLPGVGEEIGPVLVNHPDTAVIAFTGSVGVGVAINKGASIQAEGQTHVKKVIAEMGGKNAIIIDADADLDEAVKGVVDSAFGYSGQKCSACSRVIVLEPIYDAFLSRLIEATRSLTLAPAESPGCSLGPVIDEEARQRILKMIEIGKGEGTLAFAGDWAGLKDEGSYVPPHIFTDVSENSTLMQEEIFGPVLAVIKAKNLEDALRIANGTRYALTGGFFSRSPQNITEVKRRFRVGNLYINRKITGALVDRQPFGGFKMSGIGSKAGGPDYLLQFLLPRAVTENTLRRGFTPDLAG